MTILPILEMRIHCLSKGKQALAVPLILGYAAENAISGSEVH